ncbi:MAG: winged helix DNA-binding protein [Dehalococcoidia bacterium]
MNSSSDKMNQANTEPFTDEFIPLSEEHEIWLLLGQVSDGMMKARDNELRPYGLSSVQVGVLYAVTEAGGSLTGIEISRRLVRRPASVYKLLERMEKQKLVECIRNTEGKKEVRVQLTDKGKDLYRNHSRQVIPKILGKLSTREREQFKETLKKLRTRVYEELAEQPVYP